MELDDRLEATTLALRAAAGCDLIVMASHGRGGICH
jgi:nucleotide-binding universal stress UspA family protein